MSCVRRPDQSSHAPTWQASAPIRSYYQSLKELRAQGVVHESGLWPAFQNLLAETARARGWTFIPELSAASTAHRTIRPDGTVRDELYLPRGYWEAKDPADDLDAEIRRKDQRGYPQNNIIFENTLRAVLVQNRQPVGEFDLSNPAELIRLLDLFYSHTEAHIEKYEQAVTEFSESVPELARHLKESIEAAHDSNSKFQRAFESFFTLCQRSLNPNISVAAVDDMIASHLLTERLFRTVFDNPDFVRRNVIAQHIEEVIDALTARSTSRQSYLQGLNHFYTAIEDAARGLGSFEDKQRFLNEVYERFFQSYARKEADTKGIVYTPQPIVDFMCASVEEALREHLGLSLTDPRVVILDPCTGTGNFIVNLMRRMSKRDLKRMYKHQLFANEVMLLPYYIAAQNIEHTFTERTGEWEPFPGLCFVDTLDLAEGRQGELLTEQNTERVKVEKGAPVTVIIGNPPYNVGQLNENDNNKNRKYQTIDRQVSESYGHDSKATNKNSLSDVYVKFYRWASNRLEGRDGVVCFVSNNSFVDNLAFDGMRKHLLRDFTFIDHIDLHGNVRKNPKLSGTTHNVFGIQVGVDITVAVKRAGGVSRLRLEFLHFHVKLF